IDEGQAALSGSPDPVIGAMIETCRQFTGIYLFGWSAERAAAFHAALPTLLSITDPRIRSRISMMEAAILCLSADFPAACEKADEARRASRKAGVFFEYFAATLFLHWAYIHRGDLGASLRVANEDGELALRNGSPLPRLWLTVRAGWSKMEAFQFDEPLAMYERYAATPGLLDHRHNFPMLLWLGQARLGAGHLDGAWEAHDRLHQAVSEGGYPFQIVCPLANHRAECALARKDIQQARDLAAYLVQTAGEHHEWSYLARGHRLLAELDLRAGDLASAGEHVSHAQAALEKCEAWTVEWLVYATASRVFAQSGREAESTAARERALRAAHRVAVTLAGEPELRESFLARVARDLPAVRATST
ncbi:MAG TPA: hypothetical protein VKE70_29600, partial [Candidatus Solibacter sp.]|nr:hypothetical protein [Candidatus Solibacter sp.]